MGEIATAAFWLLTLASTVLAFAVPAGTLHVAAASWLLCVGTLFSALNWSCMIPRQERRPSMIPLFGGLLLGLSAWTMPWPGHTPWRLTSILCDPWYLVWVCWPIDAIYLRSKSKLRPNSE